MSQRSDRFKALKDEYEKMVERELPGWLEQLSSYRKMKEEKQAEEEKRKNEVSNISILSWLVHFFLENLTEVPLCQFPDVTGTFLRGFSATNDASAICSRNEWTIISIFS